MWFWSWEEKNSTKQKNSCTSRWVFDAFASTCLKEVASCGFFVGVTMPDHTRRRCDQAYEGWVNSLGVCRPTPPGLHAFLIS